MSARTMLGLGLMAILMVRPTSAQESSTIPQGKGDLPVQTGITQYGITWTFETPAPVGQFVNGDYYVVGPVRIKTIDPKPLWGDEVKERINQLEIKEDRYPGKQARNGSSLNPPAQKKNAGFDSRIPSGRYDPNLFARLPISMKPGDSLVSTISRPNDQIKKFGGQHVDPLRVAAVLTCVAAPQPKDAFRPSYCDTARSKIYLARNLKRDLLLSLPRVKDMPETLKTYAAGFQKPWLDLAEFGFAAPQENLPHYGQTMVQMIGEATLLLLSDYGPAEKEMLLINMVQVGIDFWGLTRAGRTWGSHGGLNSGRKWPIVFAGLLLGDPEMQSPKKHYPGVLFHEDEQTALCPVTYKGPPCPEGKTFERGWTGAKAIFTGWRRWTYYTDQKELWDGGGGPVDLFHPKEWPLPGKPVLSSEGYRTANTSPAWVGQALAVRMLHAEKIWDHDAYFAYVDRWMTEDDTAFVRVLKENGRQDRTDLKLGGFGRQAHITGAGRDWVRALWDKYRNHLPPASDGHVDPPAETTWK